MWQLSEISSKDLLASNICFYVCAMVYCLSLGQQVNGSGGGAKERPCRDAGSYRCKAEDHRCTGRVIASQSSWTQLLAESVYSILLCINFLNLNFGYAYKSFVTLD